MKKFRFLQTLELLLIFLLLIIIIAACKKSETPATPPVINPFSNGGNERNMIVIISDLHLGADTSYAEYNDNLGPLEKLLIQIKSAPNVKELVIAGDLVDEWFVPAKENTFQGKDQADFVKRLATANQGVFDAFNSIIQEGNILVTYVPGNHDLVITAADIESILPGVSQARDNVLGLGTYSPVGCSKIAIEHGHRYNFFCAPDPISNQDIAPGTILPPGYFFTRIAALCVQQKIPKPGDTLPVPSRNTTGDESQNLLFQYWMDWEAAVVSLPITNRFDEKIIVTNVNGFTGTYSVNDLVPFQSSPGGFINVGLFPGIQDNWEARQTNNHVAVHISSAEAIDSVLSNTEVDHQANLQYFMNSASDKRIVVFGHTHVPRIDAYTSYDNKKCIYANSGTWIDNNPKLTTTNFVVITPQTADESSQTLVKLYNFEHEVVSIMAEDSLHY